MPTRRAANLAILPAAALAMAPGIAAAQTEQPHRSAAATR
jgi:hypothetical protein